MRETSELGCYEEAEDWACGRVKVDEACDNV